MSIHLFVKNIERPLYEEDKPFTCLDGSRTISFDRVNDDYCDCQDGSDEPGLYALNAEYSIDAIHARFLTKIKV